MGSIPCDIIVGCGALKSKAAELGAYPFELLKPIALEMFNFEEELCDNSTTLSENLNLADKVRVAEQSRRGWSFALQMQTFMNMHASSLTDRHVDQGASDIADFYIEMRSFLDAQMKFFFDLVQSYTTA